MNLLFRLNSDTKLGFVGVDRGSDDWYMGIIVIAGRVIITSKILSILMSLDLFEIISASNLYIIVLDYAIQLKNRPLFSIFGCNPNAM